MTLDPIINAEPAIQLHLAAALGAFVTGVLILTRRKGDILHRITGALFVVLMIATAMSALLITGVMEMAGPEWKGWYSPIHLLVPMTLFGVYKALRAIEIGDTATHKKEMRGLFFGALLFAGALAFLPGRTLWQVVFG